MTEKRKGGGGKLSRSETVTVRLDPRLRYLAELAARKQHRTLSSFIEWCLEDVLSRTIMKEGCAIDEPSATLLDEGRKLWSNVEAVRFVKLAEHYPELLTPEEDLIRAVIQKDPRFYRPAENSKPHLLVINDDLVIFSWDILQQLANKEISRSRYDDLIHERIDAYHRDLDFVWVKQPKT